MSLDLVIENASQVDIQILKYHARRIMNLLKNKASVNVDFTSEIDVLELPELIPETEEVEKKLDLNLSNVLYRIHKNKALGRSAVKAFLATVPNRDVENREKYLVIQARLLLVVYELRQKIGYEDFIVRALREYRILIKEARWEWLDTLPDFTKHISDLVDELEQVREILPVRAKQRTLAFESLLKQYQKNKAVYKPKKVDRKAKKNDIPGLSFEKVVSRVSFDEGETSYIEFLPEVSGAETGIEYDEHVADQFVSKRFYKFTVVAPDEVKESLSLQLTAVKSVANHIQRREKMLISDFSFLTDYDVTTLVKHCFKNLIQGLHHCVLLIMLFTGKSLDEVIMSIDDIKLPSEPPFDKSAIFLFKPNLPEHKVDSDMESSLDRSRGSVIQALPIEIRNCILRFKNQLKSKEIVENVKQT